MSYVCLVILIHVDGLILFVLNFHIWEAHSPDSLDASLFMCYGSNSVHVLLLFFGLLQVCGDDDVPNMLCN